MKTLAYSYHPQIVFVQRFINNLGGHIPRQAVRAALSELYTSPPMNLLTLSQVLKALEIASFAYQTNLIIEENLLVPSIAMIQDGQRKRLVIIEKVENNEVLYFKVNTGGIKEPAKEFLERWTGVLLKAQIDDTNLNINSVDEELEGVDQYREEGVKVVDDFLTQEECDYIIEYAENSNAFERSQIVANGETSHHISSNRSSFSAYLNNRNKIVFKKIYKKVSSYLNLPEEYLENMQVVRYKEGQEFKPHIDPKSDTDRKYTTLIYLNDDFGGGETYFPELDLKISPKKGRMLCFLNRDDNNQIIPFSTHAGLPIRNGIKYGCNIWVGSSSVFEDEKR